MRGDANPAPSDADNWICPGHHANFPIMNTTCADKKTGCVTLTTPSDAARFTREALVPMNFRRRQNSEPFCAGGEYRDFGAMVLTHMWSRGRYSAAAAASEPVPRFDHVLITLCLKGSAELQVSGRVVLRAGQAIILPCDKISGLDANEELATLSVRAPIDRLGHSLGAELLEPLLLEPISTETGLSSTLAVMIQSLWAQRDKLTQNEARYLLEALGCLVLGVFEEKFSDLGATTASRQAQYWRIRRDILATMRQPDQFGITQTSLRIGKSRRSIQATLRQMGTTFGNLALELRLSQAARLLRSSLATHSTITEMALTLGFEDVAHFSRRFRARFGESPRQYRAACRSE